MMLRRLVILQYVRFIWQPLRITPNLILFSFGATVTAGAEHIVVVELKGPDDTAGWPEYEQLNSYVSYLKSRFPSNRVEGILVARSHDEGVKENAGRTIAFKEWNELLLRSRKEHMELIAALLAGAKQMPWTPEFNRFANSAVVLLQASSHR